MPSEDIQHIFISAENQLIKHVWNFVSYQSMVGISVSLLQDIWGLEGNIYAQGQKYAALFN